MADAVNAGFARSEKLKEQWASLKREMLAIDSNTPDAAHRRNDIHNRMDQIMTDMATVLTETRRLIPTSQTDLDHSPSSSPAANPYVQYSARKLHIVHRTYDSSEDGSDFDSSQPLNQQQHSHLNDEVDLCSLRQDMMNHAHPHDVVTVESKGIRASLHTFKEKLRKPESNRSFAEDKDKPNIPPPSPRGKPLSTDDREDLAVEQSRLERESRRLKRKPQRSPDDDSRLEDIANRLSRISSTLADGGAFEPAETSPITPAPNSSGPPSSKKVAFNKPPRLERSTPVSPLADHDEELAFDSVEDEGAPQSARANQKPGSSKRKKKGWMALEAGVASFRALGRTMRTSAVSTGKDSKPDADMSPTRRGNGKKTPSSHSAGESVFSDTTDRLNKRGERLNSMSNEADEMNSDAGDMLAAARSLRQRNQKGGFFS